MLIIFQKNIPSKRKTQLFCVLLQTVDFFYSYFNFTDVAQKVPPLAKKTHQLNEKSIFDLFYFLICSILSLFIFWLDISRLLVSSSLIFLIAYFLNCRILIIIKLIEDERL